jgi:hypothetical protein
MVHDSDRAASDLSKRRQAQLPGQGKCGETSVSIDLMRLQQHNASRLLQAAFSFRVLSSASTNLILPSHENMLSSSDVGVHQSKNLSQRADRGSSGVSWASSMPSVNQMGQNRMPRQRSFLSPQMDELKRKMTEWLSEGREAIVLEVFKVRASDAWESSLITEYRGYDAESVEGLSPCFTSYNRRSCKMESRKEVD